MKGSKAVIFTSLLLVIVISLSLVGCTQPTPDEPIELSLSCFLPANTPIDQHLNRWADKIAADSNDRLTIRIYPGGTLFDAIECYDGVASGGADIGAGFPKKSSLISESIGLFMAGVPDAETAKVVYDETYPEFECFKAEWQECKLLWTATQNPFALHTVTPVRTLEDLQGMQIRTNTKQQAEVVTALGATPVSMPISEMIPALQKGLVQGTTGPYDMIASTKLADGITNYTTDIPLFAGLFFWVVMNNNSFNNLPKDLQKIIEDSQEWGEKDCLETCAGLKTGAINFANSVGYEFITLAPEEEERWFAKIRVAQDKGAADLDAQGYPGTEMLQFVRGRVDYYTK